MRQIEEVVSMEGVSDRYELIRELLDKYQFETNPIYSGFGLEVYQVENNKMSQMVVDFSHNEIRVNIIPLK